jgi:hypothetical protein
MSLTVSLAHVNADNNRIRIFCAFIHLITDDHACFLTVRFISLLTENLDNRNQYLMVKQQIYWWLTFVHQWEVCAILPLNEIEFLIKVTMIETI